MELEREKQKKTEIVRENYEEWDMNYILEVIPIYSSSFNAQLCHTLRN